MKNTKFKIQKYLFAIGAVILLLAGAAHAVSYPSTSVINPITQTLFVPNNGGAPATIRVYERAENSSTQGWVENIAKTIAMPSSTAKIFGMAVTDDGTKLLVSVSNAQLSKLRVYTLDSSGLPDGTFTDAAGWTAGTTDSPAGVALAGNRAYVVDSLTKKIRYFDYDGSAWNYSGALTSEVGGIYQIAIGPINNVYQFVPMGGRLLISKKYMIFVSRKGYSTTTKELFVYQYSWTITGGETITPVASYDAMYPTNMKVVNDMLYVAVNGSSGGDIQAYQISDSGLTLLGTVSSDITGAFGWAGLAVTPDNNWLYYTQAQDSAENTTKLYRIQLPVSSDATATAVTGTIKADGLCVSPDGAHIAATYSGNGNMATYDIDINGDGSPDFLVPVLESITPSSTTYGKPVYVVIKGKYFVKSLDIQSQAWLHYEDNYQIQTVEVDSSTQMHGWINGTAKNGARPYFGYVVNADLNSAPPDNKQQGADVANAFTINFTKPQNLKGFATDEAGNPLIGGQIRWTWDPNNQGENYYDLVSSDGTVVKGPISAPNTTTVLDDSLNPNAQYTRKLRVRFVDLLSAESDLVSVYSSAATPSITTISAETTPVVHVALATGGNPTGTRYEIWRTTDEAVAYTLVSTNAATAIDDTSVQNGVKYYYKARALNEDNQPSAFSIVKSVDVPLQQLPPNNPTNLRQYKGTTLIPNGGRTNSGTVIFKMMMTDPNNPDNLTPHVRIDGTGEADGTMVPYYGSAVEGVVTVSSIAEGSHTWEARVTDSSSPTALSSSWVTGETFIVDRVAPQVVSTNPANGTSTPNLSAPIKIKFSEDMDPTLFTSSTLIVKQNGAVTTQTITYDPSTYEVTLTPQSAYTNGSTIDVTVIGGVNGVKDLAGNALVSDYKFSFVAGTIEAITVRSPSAGIGWYAGKTRNITWETSGVIPNVKIEVSYNNGGLWQTITATTPNTGSYTWNIPANVSGDFCLIRVSDASDGVPSGTSANFEIFIDNNAPVVTGTYPASGESGIASDVTMVATFEDAYGVDRATLNANNIRVSGSIGGSYSITPPTASYQMVAGKAVTTSTFSATTPFVNGELVTVHLVGGASGISDWAGNTISDYSWSFTVGTSSGSPTVISILPNTGVQNTRVPVVKLTGSFFATGAKVTLTRSGQTPISATNEVVASASQITCVLPIPAGAMIGSWDVTVTNPDTKSGTLPNGFTIFAFPGSGPIVGMSVPNHGAQGSTVPAAIQGDNFQTGATVMLARVSQPNITGDVTSVPNSHVISVNFNLPANAVVGLWSIIVTNPDGQQGVLYNGFNITSNNPGGVATITNVYPRRGPNDKATDIRIIGTNFVAGNAVEIQTIPAVSLDNIIVNSGNMISATVPAGITPVGIYHITVTNNEGASDQTAADTFEAMQGKEVPPTASIIKDFNATDGATNETTLTWTNPADNDMATIEVRRYSAGYPASYDASGTLVFTDIPTPGASVSIKDTGLNSGTTYYYAAFIGDTSGNWSAVDSTTPEVNADTAVTGGTPPGGFTTNESIVRNADTQGSSVTISWQANPLHASADIYTLEKTAGQVMAKADFSTAANWTKMSNPVIITNGNLDTIIDANQVGTGTQKYYKIVPQGHALIDADLTTGVVGKFDLTVGPEPDKLFVSIPVEPSNSSPEAVIGGQAMNLDMIVSFNISREAAKGSIFQGTTWSILPGAAAILDSVGVGDGYGYVTSTARYITVAGRVRESQYSRNLTGNSSANWVATPYPYSYGVANAGLNASSSNSNPTLAAMCVSFNASAEAIGGTDGIAFHYAPTEWREGTLQNPSPLMLKPGMSYMLLEPAASDVNWTISR